MPGQIKIDDGAGNYTILTNAGSLGSDKTITLPNETATLATTNASNLGGLVKLASATASSSSELVFDNFVDTSTYVSYKIFIQYLKGSANNTAINCIFRQGGASGSDLTGNYLNAGYESFMDVVTNGFLTGTSTTMSLGISTGVAAKYAKQYELQMFPADGTNSTSNLYSTNAGQRYNNDYSLARPQYFVIEDQTAVTGIRFYMSSGNIASGTIIIYGVKK
jgi:hypothetical protein